MKRLFADAILIRLTNAGFFVKPILWAGIATSGQFETVCGGYSCGRNFLALKVEIEQTCPLSETVRA